MEIILTVIRQNRFEIWWVEVTYPSYISPALFQKWEKGALIWEKITFIAVIYGSNFSFIVHFLRLYRSKIRRFFLRGLSFSFCR